MNNTRLFLIALVLLTWGCDENVNSLYKVDLKEFKDRAADSLLIDVDRNGAMINLKGELKLTGGACALYMRNPEQDTIYSQFFKLPGKFSINESFLRTEGEYAFFYELLELDQEKPSGSLWIKVNYSN